MKLTKVIELIAKYTKCQGCGSEMIGNGAGTLEVTDNMFRRTCKCGWKIEIKEDNA